jgi:hypothetical protein
MNRWKSKVIALRRLAADQRGKPEGELARQKLLHILEKYPEAREYEPIQEFARREFSMGDLGYMKRNSIDTDGSWTGATIEEAIACMVADYRVRIEGHKRPKLRAPKAKRRWLGKVPWLPEPIEVPDV